MRSLLSRPRPEGGDICSWLGYWVVPSFSLVGLLFGVFGAILLFFADPEYRLAPTVSNLRIALLGGFVLWLFYGFFLWVGLSIICRLGERVFQLYAKRRKRG